MHQVSAILHWFGETLPNAGGSTFTKLVHPFTNLVQRCTGIVQPRTGLGTTLHQVGARAHQPVFPFPFYEYQDQQEVNFV
jgi:hypothetical protein